MTKVKVILNDTQAVKYNVLVSGQTFRCPSGRAIYIKTDRSGVSGRQAIHLTSGVCYSYPDDYLVIQVDAEVHVKWA